MIRSLRTASRGRRAFTFIELVISVAMMGVVLGSVSLFQLRSQQHTDSILVNERVDTQSRRTLTRIADELRGVAMGLLVPDPTTSLGTSSLIFQRPIDVTNAGVVVWGNPSRLALLLEPTETNNGVDDDGDALVDERRLVLTRDLGTAEEQSTVLCTGISELAQGELGNGGDDNGNGLVDEAGFSIRRVGDLLTIRLTVLAPSGGGESVSTTAETSVVLRN